MRTQSIGRCGHTYSRKNPIHVVGIVILLVFSVTSCSHSQPRATRQPTQTTDKERTASLTEFRNCESAKARFPSMLDDDTVECTEDYLLYESNVKTKLKLSNLRIGSFNVIRIGQSQVRFKRNDLVADIINQWDLVNVVEIMTSGKDLLAHNEKIDRLAESTGTKDRGDIEASYQMPKYLVILQELRKLDPSWSLIMAPSGTGETTASYEYSGFFYRYGFVENAETSFCGDKRGCLTPISRENYENLVSRSPFVAHFKVGKLKFNAAGLHLRFRAPAEDCATASGDSKKGQKKCVDYSAAEQKLVKDYLEVAGRIKVNKEDARYMELAVAERELRKSEEPILLMGDFNLEFNDRTRKLWNFAVGHDNVFVREKTSISAQNGLANEYDHFVFVPEKTLAKCKTETAKAFNFMLDLVTPKTSDPDLKDLESFLVLRKNRTKALEEYQISLREQLSATTCSKTDCEMAPLYDPVAAANLVCLYERNVLGNESKKCVAEGEAEDEEDAPTPGKKPVYKVFHEIISDHIPIEMECAIN